MPLYEYRCGKCGKVFEVLQKFSDAPLTAHPECGGKVERLVSASSFQLKGGGWYATDYAKPGGKAAEKSGDKSDPKSESKPDTKSSETKSSETKSDTKIGSKPAPAKTT